MVVIPQEIWMNIMGYLPATDVERLFSLNRPLFNIYMDRKYKRIYLGPLDQDLSKPILLCQELLACRARSLSIQINGARDLHTASDYIKYTAQQFTRFSASLLKDKLPFIDSYRKRPLMCLLSHMQNFKSVHEFQLDSLDSGKGLDQPALSYTPLVRKAFDTFGINLVTLELTLSMDALESYVLPSTTFPLLHDLTLHLEQSSSQEETEKMIRRTLLPMINRHTENLRRISLDAWNNVDLSTVLQHVEYLPRLSSFKLMVGYDNTKENLFNGLHTFLQWQCESLSALHLEFYAINKDPNYKTWFSKSCFHVPLPRLESLILRLHDFPDQIVPDLGEYVNQFKSTLNSLILKGNTPFKECRKKNAMKKYGHKTLPALRVPRFSMQQVEDLGKILSTPTPNHIQDLQLEIHSSNPDLYVPLTRHYPQIKSFSARFHYNLEGPELLGVKEKASFSYARYYSGNSDTINDDR